MASLFRSNVLIIAIFYVYFCVSCLSFADSPLPGIIEYTQQVVIKCSDAEDAKTIKLVPMKLPNNAKVAFSARWDDSNMQHLKTHQIMQKNGIKGTFYLNGWANSKYGQEYCRKLLKGGCSIGAHSRTHKSLPSLNPNEMFYEIMSVRLMKEAESNSLISTMVLPFCRFGVRGDPQIQKDIGKAMMNAGFIGAPEIYYGNYAGYMGYPNGTLAEASLIRAGDRSVNAEKFRTQTKHFLNLGATFEKNPCLAVGIHSWHTSEGQEILDGLLSESAHNEDWWYCNQNEYAAYRFEFNNCKIDKHVDGNNAVFTITRYTPESLGENVDLWFTISDVKKQVTLVDPQVATIDNGMLQLPHSKSQLIPEIIAIVDSNGVSSKIPDVKCLFSVNDLFESVVTLRNEGGTQLENVIFTLRSGSGFTPGVITQQISPIKSGGHFTGKWQLKHADSIRYLLGNPYYVAQFDFTRKNKRYRLYAEYRNDKVAKQPVVVSTFAQGFIDTDGQSDYSLMSKIDSSLKSSKLKKLESKNSNKLSKDAIAFAPSKKELDQFNKELSIVTVLDFIPEQAGQLTVSTKANHMFLNGSEIQNGEKANWQLPVIMGRNRLVIVTNYPALNKLDTNYFFTQGIKIKKYCSISH